MYQFSILNLSIQSVPMEIDSSPRARPDKIPPARPGMKRTHTGESKHSPTNEQIISQVFRISLNVSPADHVMVT